MLGSWIQYKALILFLKSVAKEFIDVHLTNFNFVTLFKDSSYIHLHKISAQIRLLSGHT